LALLLSFFFMQCNESVRLHCVFKSAWNWHCFCLSFSCSTVRVWCPTVPLKVPEMALLLSFFFMQYHEGMMPHFVFRSAWKWHCFCLSFSCSTVRVWCPTLSLKVPEMALLLSFFPCSAMRVWGPTVPLKVPEMALLLSFFFMQYREGVMPHFVFKSAWKWHCFCLSFSCSTVKSWSITWSSWCRSHGHMPSHVSCVH